MNSVVHRKLPYPSATSIIVVIVLVDDDVLEFAVTTITALKARPQIDLLSKQSSLLLPSVNICYLVRRPFRSLPFCSLRCEERPACPHSFSGIFRNQITFSSLSGRA